MYSPLNSFFMLRCILMWLCLCTVAFVQGQGYILISMDENQTNHMKAYGITYQVLEAKQEAYWLLNYEGGSFAFQYHEIFKNECIRRGVSFKIIPTASFNSILSKISSPEVNMEAMKLEVAPKIAVYSPTVNVRGNEVQPWDDAVTLVLTYAEIPYDLVYDDEVLAGKLNEYDWLHLHHEDFTGQFGKFFSNYSNQKWYKDHVRQMETLAQKHGYEKVSQLKLAVVKKNQRICIGRWIYVCYVFGY